MTTPIVGRRVLITGASSGIGEATVRALLQQGAHVAGIARRAQRMADIPELRVFAGDISEPETAVETVTSAAHGLGGLDVLINAAGVSFGGAIATGSFDDWRVTFEVNVLGLLAVTQAAIPFLRTGDAPLIINVSSMSGHRILSPHNTVYGASKHAVQAITAGLRKELADDGIRVTAISPSYVRGTEIHEHHRDPQLAARSRRSGEEFGIEMADFVDAMLYLAGTSARTGVRQLDLSASNQPD